MAELDYAYLADFAQIEGGKISALGASFTHVRVGSLPSMFLTSIAGRVRASEDEDPALVRVEIADPDNGYRLKMESQIPKSDATRPYRGKVGLLFTLTSQIPLITVGVYTVDIFVNDEHARALAFEVEESTEP